MERSVSQKEGRMNNLRKSLNNGYNLEEKHFYDQEIELIEKWRARRKAEIARKNKEANEAQLLLLASRKEIKRAA